MPSRRRSRIKSISGNINDVQKRLRYLETRPAPSQLAKKVVATQNIALRAITPDVVDDGAIVRRTLAPEAVISANLAVVGDPDDAAVATENIQLSAVDTDQIADDAIKTAKIDDLSVTTSKIDDLAVITAKIDDLAVITAKIDDLAVITEKIDDLAVITEKIDDLAVTNEKLAGLITSDKIDSVDASTISVGQIESDQIASVDAATITVGFIDSTQIDSVDAATITVGLIQDDQIDGISGEKIIGGIDGDLIVAGTVSGAGTNGSLVSKIVANTIGENDIATDGVGFDELQVDSVGTAQLQVNSVVEVILDDLSVSRRTLQDEVIIASKINAGAVQTEKIQNLAVTNAKIANTTITGGKIADSTITSNKISSGTDIVTSVTDNAVGLSVGTSNATYGKSVVISVSTGNGASQLALGNHTHPAGPVGSHTHPVSASISGSVTGTGDHGGATHTGNHSHGLSISSTITTQAPSSLKLKKEISDYQPADIKNILNLKLKKYKYKNQLRHLHEGINREWMHGYIAEEVLELGFEELLGYDEKGEPASLNYGLLSTLILELVKVQQTEIDSLKEEIQRLKEKI